VAFTDVLQDPKTAHSDNPKDSVWNRAYNEQDITFFEWLETPENESRRRRFNVAMEGVSQLDDGESMLRGKCEAHFSEQWLTGVMVPSGFPWGSIAKGAKVVDVGGGIGSVSLTVARQFPELKFIIQDVPSMIGQGEKVNFCLQRILLELSVSSSGTVRCQKLATPVAWCFKVKNS